MSIELVVSDKVLNKVVDQILGGYSEEALARLVKLGLSHEMVAKVQAILLKMNPSHLTMAPLELKDRILAVLNPEAKVIPILPNDHIEHICFSESPTCAFAMTYPCQIEFGGMHYSTATACFLAQQYTDQIQIMELFSQCDTAEEAFFLNSTCTMTEEREHSWENLGSQHINKKDVMMHVLRAKFGQNPELQEKLLEADGMYFVCQDSDLFWGDCLNGNGQNELGISLMRLLGEYGGAGIVEPTAGYSKMTLDVRERSYSLVLGFNEDFFSEIFKHCLSKSDYSSIAQLSYVNRYFYKEITKLVDKLIQKLCPFLTILDAETLEFKVDDEPGIDKFSLLQCYQEMAPRVQGNCGITLLTIPKGTTLNQLVKIAENAGITIDVWPQILKEIGDISVEYTYRVLITNSIFINTTSLCYDDQCKSLLNLGYKVPNIREQVALCLYQKIFNDKCLYGKKIYGSSSTSYQDYCLTLGGCISDRIVIVPVSGDYALQNVGAGGQKRFIRK